MFRWFRRKTKANAKSSDMMLTTISFPTLADDVPARIRDIEEVLTRLLRQFSPGSKHMLFDDVERDTRIALQLLELRAQLLDMSTWSHRTVKLG